jgi:hypothetical protein
MDSEDIPDDVFRRELDELTWYIQSKLNLFFSLPFPTPGLDAYELCCKLITVEHFILR